MVKKLFLVDAYALIYRAHFAFINSPMYNSKGFNTSTVYGFVSAIEEVIRTQKPTHFAVAFDTSSPTFRHEMYPEYKSHRPPTPENIRESIPYIKTVLEAMNIHSVVAPGFEADDIVGTLAKVAEQQDYQVYMMTSDKDYGQLVSDKVFIYKPKKGGGEAEVLGIEEINKKHDIKNPKQVIDILALMGDASDHIPGLPGVGEKTAAKLIAVYNSVDELVERMNELPEKQKKLVSENIENLRLSQKLVTIDCNVPCVFNEEQLVLKPVNAEKVREIFSELNFKSLLTRVLKETPAKTASTAYVQTSLFGDTAPQMQPSEDELLHQEIISNYQSINDIVHEYVLVDTNNIQSVVNELDSFNEICFDTETTGLDPYHDFLVGISFSAKKGKAFYIPLSQNFENAQKQLQLFEPLFRQAEKLFIGHNIKFDILFLHRYGIEIKGQLYDTMIAHYLLEPEKPHKMDALAENYLKYKPIAIEELIGKKGVGQRNMSQVPVQVVSDYACEDADVTFQFKEIFDKLLKDNALDSLFYTIENKLLRVIIDMELAGVSLDETILRNYSKILTTEIKTIEESIYQLAGQQFNIASPKQLGDVLFEKLKIAENSKLTKTKQYSTSEETLQELQDAHPIIAKILEYRSLSKLLSTYVDSLPKLVNSNTKRIHTSFNQTIAVTGRLSSTNPNLQNIPIRDERGREIRKAFIASDNQHVMLSADYSQIELRLMAHICNDPSMIEAFRNNEDIHTATAAKIFKVENKDVTREQRSKAKTANFGIIYGISAFGLSQRLRIPRKEAQELIDEYFVNFPGVRTYMTNIIETAREKGYVETMMGRKRFLADINSKNVMVRNMAERNAINSPIQGTAADVIKLAMINIDASIKQKQLKTKMIMQVHDELVFDVPLNELDEVKQIVKHEMENAVSLNVPLLVEMGSGKNWVEAH